jgi:hypothetical protein
MKAFAELLYLMRIGQCRASVAYYLHDIERAKEGLARAYNALDAANANLAIHDTGPRPIPRFLLKGIQ